VRAHGGHDLSDVRRVRNAFSASWRPDAGEDVALTQRTPSTRARRWYVWPSKVPLKVTDVGHVHDAVLARLNIVHRGELGEDWPGDQLAISPFQMRP
jgi:hypothetical protein